MKRVLLTGMSGTGKSTVNARLGELGYKVVDSDYGGFTVEVDSGGRERLWREDRIQEVLSTEDAEVLFISGTSRNQVRFYPQFDQIVLLTAPADVLVDRLHNRTNNRYGKTAAELTEPRVSQNGRAAAEKPRDAGDRHECITGSGGFRHFGTRTDVGRPP